MKTLTVVPGERRETVKVPERRIHLIPFEDIKLSPHRRDLVKGIIPRVGLTVLWGPPKCGKSFWMFDCMMHVALGWEYRGRRVHQGPVVYCAFEGQTGIEARVAAFRQKHLEDYGQQIPFFLMPVTIDLVRDHTTLMAGIKSTLIDVDPVSVVLDTVNRSLRGSESSDEDMSAYIRAADTIREEYQCAVPFVHHCGIDGTRPRGHTSLPGAVEAQLACKRDGADNIIVDVELMKDGPQGEVLASKLEVMKVGIDEDGDDITSCIIVPIEDFKPSANTKSRKLSDRDKLALDALDEVSVTGGKPPPPSMQLPVAVRVVSLEAWRTEVLARGIIDRESANPRTDFNRIKTKLTSRGLIGERDNLVWRAS
jgi:hypothetical protein